MELFRHHTTEFQKLIEASNEFVIDKSRHFHIEGQDKNAAKLYFYGINELTALDYKTKETKLFTYEFEGNVLDLRVVENRALLTNVLNRALAKEQECREELRRILPKKYITKRIKADATIEDVVNSSLQINDYFWGQACTDKEMGVEMRKDLERLGYDGVIFSTHPEKADVALLKPATQI